MTLSGMLKSCLLSSLLFLPTVQSISAADLNPGEWFVRIKADVPSENLSDRGNVLGWLKKSTDGADPHDLKELSPLNTLYLTVVFPHPDWGDSSGNYASDFHKQKHWRSGDEWEFVVKSDIPRHVTLSWQGNEGQKRLYRMRLMDMETGKIIRAVRRKTLQTYTFSMVDKIHRFKWIYLARPAL